MAQFIPSLLVPLAPSLVGSFFDFNPTAIPDLSVWYDASNTDSITESGGAVSQWDDLSGNNNNAVQTTGTLQPSYNATGLDGVKPSIDFVRDNNHELLPIAAIEPPTISVFTVNKVNIGGFFQGLIGNRDSGPFTKGWGLGWSNVNQNQFSIRSTAQASFNSINESAFSIAEQQVKYIRGGIAGNGSSIQRIISSDKTRKNVLSFAGEIDYSGYTDGANIAGRANISVSEIIVYGRPLTDVEQDKVIAYLKNKWVI